MRVRLTTLTLLLAALAAAAALATGCGEEAASTPLSLRSPSRFIYAPQCIVEGRWMDPAECQGSVIERAFVTNVETASLAYVDITRSGATLRDANRAVPGITAVRVGERPQAAVATADGAFVLTVNTVSRDISLVEVARHRELTAFPTDDIGVALARDPATGEIWVGYASGRIEVRQLAFDCGAGVNVYVDGCTLEPAAVTLEVVDLVEAPGRIQSMIVDPTRARVYVAYADRLYVSAFALEGSEEPCIEGSSGAHCEVLRLPGGYSCSDGLDNDGDGLIDAADPQCYSRSGAESPDSAGYFQTTACSDGIDNDGDGLIDSFDPGCVSPNDASEEPGLQLLTPTACTDGLDNDGDGLIDNRDPDCTNPDVDDEGGSAGLQPACQDGVDNDGDGLIDFPDDPDCTSPNGDTEASTPACRDGLDNDGDGLVDFPDDPGCASPDDPTESPTLTACRDGIDNDGDGLVDLADDGCYGAAGATERSVQRIGLGPLGIDPLGRWLYIVDRSEWQLIVVDLEAGALIDAGARNPYTDQPGIRVNPVPQAVAGDIRSGILVESSDGSRIERDEAVAYVATTAGTLDVVSIHQTFRRIDAQGALVDNADTYTLRIGDLAGGSVAAATNVRCVGFICPDSALPSVTVRQRPTILVTEDGRLQTTDTNTAGVPMVPADEIFIEESWWLTYEGILPGAERTDGVLTAPGLLSSGASFCSLGVKPGDRLVITSSVAASSTASDETCQALSRFRVQNGVAPEWEVLAVRPNAVQLGVVEGSSGGPFVDVLPTRECYPFGVAFEVRASQEWVAQAEVTPSLLRLDTVGGECVEPVRDALGDGRIETGVPYNNGLFSLTIPASFPNLVRGAAIQFAVRDGYTPLRRATGPLPGDVQVVESPLRRLIFVTDEGADQVFIFDADRLTALESL